MIETAVKPETLTHEEAVSRAKALAPRIRERALRAERERKIPRESIDEFVDAGLGRIMTPKRWGGYEMSHDTACDVILEIGKACGSTAWCTSFLLTHVWWFTAFPIEAQADVYADGPDVNMAASFSERGDKQVVPVPGGFRLTGRWKWASGVDHSTWTMVGGVVPPGEEPQHTRIFIVPKNDYRIEDTWHNVGLRATGSNDVLIDDVFVPEHRSVRLQGIRDCTAPGRLVIDGDPYRLPQRTRNHELIAPALGAVRGAFEEWKSWSRGRASNYSGAKLSDDVHKQLATSHIETDLDAAELILRRNLALIRNGGPIDEPTRALIHASGGRSMEWICSAADSLLHISGASGLFDDNPIQRAWRDARAISAHGSLNAGNSGVARGRVLLGLEETGPAGFHD
jgi:3-hydroxy-9,10-secoandrosta-1,3,5(10)-triene-9,17-dione monooxygenase